MLVRGLEMTPVSVPLHIIHLTSKLVTGDVIVGVRSFLPVWGKVWGNTHTVAPPIVVAIPEIPQKPDECV